MTQFRAKIYISGTVQGVGFRPFIHKLSEKFNISGFIRNTTSGAELQIRAEEDELNSFIFAVKKDLPELAMIERIIDKRLPVYGKDISAVRQKIVSRRWPLHMMGIMPQAMYEGCRLPEEGCCTALQTLCKWNRLRKERAGLFRIIKSTSSGDISALVPPDTCICDDCLDELFDPKDRRYKYPFINCTNCGPRFTIIHKIPYDRVNTSMQKFQMCERCEKEYTDINNRRFHAQPDCCAECGPEVFLIITETDSHECNTYDRDSSINDNHGMFFNKDDISEGVSLGIRDVKENCIYGREAIEKSAEYLLEGKIIAVKGLGGFHLACRADSIEAVERLRHRKHRDKKPFAIMMKNVSDAEKICFISKAEKEALESKARPIVLLKKKNANAHSYISENGRIGVMLPYTPLHYLIFDSLENVTNIPPAQGIMLIMTSANDSDEPLVYDNNDALKKLSGIADGFLMHNRDIVTSCDDSLVCIFEDKLYPVRRSRGYVPAPIYIKSSGQNSETPAGAPDILACGADMKGGFALTKDNSVFLSQHIGDMSGVKNLLFYETQLKHFKALFDIEPKIIACDMHPDYVSSHFAESVARTGNELIRVQHHHAHMVSCMADNGLDEPCIGVIWDGTGAGTDGTVWGGEFLVGDFSGFERAGSILPFKLPGGDTAVKEIQRIAVSLITESFKSSESVLSDADVETICSGIFSRNFSTENNIRTSINMIKYDINCPETTSIGRLFDGIAALLGICFEAGYEGRGAMLLEACGERAEERERSADTCSLKAAAGIEDACLPYEIIKDEIWRFDHRPMIRKIIEIMSDYYENRNNNSAVSDVASSHSDMDASDLNTDNACSLKSGYICSNSEDLALMFMNTLSDMAVKMVKKISYDSGLKKIVLSGGCFQNMYLLKKIVSGLRKEGFEVYTHHHVPSNDAGIALGQAAAARALLSRAASAEKY